MTTPTNIKKTHIDHVVTRLKSSLPDDEQRLALQFAELYYKNVSVSESTSLSEDSIYGSFFSLWKFIQERKKNENSVRVYNPTVASCGWSSTHTIVDILTEDKPFLVSTLILAFSNKNLRIYDIAHPIMSYVRDDNGMLKDVLSHRAKVEHGCKEALIRIEVECLADQKNRDDLVKTIEKAIADVTKVFRDWSNMTQKLDEAVNYCKNNKLPLPSDVVDSSVDFLNWLKADNFLFIGYECYDIGNTEEGTEISLVEDSGLGYFRAEQSGNSVIKLSPHVVSMLQEPKLLILTKSTLRSNIHRYSYLDHVGVKRYKETKDGFVVVGEWRFFGLLSSRAYETPLSEIPLVNEKAKKLVSEADAPLNSHNSRNIAYIMHQYPRDELLQADFSQLTVIIKSIVESQERRQLRLFLRSDSYDRYISAMIYVPKERFNTDLRKKLQHILLEELDASNIDFSVRISEYPLAQLRCIALCSDTYEKVLQADYIEKLMIEATYSWQDKLHHALVEAKGEVEGNLCFSRYADAFPLSYREDAMISQAITEIENIESFSESETIKANLYRMVGDSENVYFRVLGQGKIMALSSIMPIMEKMKLDVLKVSPYQIKPKNKEPAWILDFSISAPEGVNLEDSRVKEQFQQTFIRVWKEEIENDGFNALVLNAKISWQQVILVRAIAKHMLQLAVPFSPEYIQQTLLSNPEVVFKIVALFEVRFNPDYEGDRNIESSAIVKDIEGMLENVANLDQDRILRNYLTILQGMLRTNFYQKAEDGSRKSYLSYKVNTPKILFAPLPRPEYEIFVYSTRLEGVHMRGGKVARGGLRWSDRPEDFRTEVLGLVKAQMVKNSVIVPVGAKGGFFPKQLPVGGSRDEYLAEGIASYRMFISGLLDITDNLKQGKIIPPKRVIRYDDDDPYLVVAADKGTATFSDIANEVSLNYGFWLGDAFASGGSNGYDHKKMGITARGAWESVKCLFQEIGVDTQSEDFTAIGIGDMSGDVFGNGMLLSRHIRLIAAFNHLDIFIDPNPDAATSFEERQRLFNLPRSSWSDYNPSLISQGGGVFSRQTKSINLSTEARKALGISALGPVSPNELIKMILQAPVDLLWNGGIGTYVKSSKETNDQVGDRANDAVRINATKLRAKVVGEGGNLGFTQSARIEFSRLNGLINTDAVDNSAGVDTSDHEVNIKILLNQLVDSNDMTIKQRNELLMAMTDEVGLLVIRHNAMQSRRISLSTFQADRLFNDHRLLIKQFEAEGRLNRKLECLPTNAELKERAKMGENLTRPEIAVLISFAKLKLFDEMIHSEMHEDRYIASMLPKYFPTALRERFIANIEKHPLKNEILATYVANEIINSMGAPSIEYIKGETHCSTLDAVKSFFVTWEVLELKPILNHFSKLGTKIANDVQLEELTRFQKYVEKAVVLISRKYAPNLDIHTLVEKYKKGMQEVSEKLLDMLGKSDCLILEERKQKLIDAGLSEEIALSCINLRYRYYMFDIIDIAEKTGKSFTETARIYFALEERLSLPWLRAQLRGLPEGDLWQRKARSSLRDQLDYSLSANTAKIMKLEADSPSEKINLWLKNSVNELEHWNRMVSDVKSVEHVDFAMLSVAVQGLSRLASEH